MNPLESVNQYLLGLERRLKMFALSRGSAAVAAVALLVTVLMVLFTNHYAFSSTSLLLARLVLFLSLGIAVALGLVLPFLKVNRRRAAGQVERQFPQFEQRLLTLAERKADASDPFTSLLASDAAEVARSTEPARVAPATSLFGFLLSSAAAAGVLLWLILAGPGYMGHGASLLWAGVGKAGSTSTFYDIIVNPGDRTVRRRSDPMVTAELVGYDSRNVRLRAKFDGSSKWEDVQMAPRPGAPGFEFVFAAIPNGVEYYVEAGPLTSKHYRLNVIDLPSIKNVKVMYRFPAWTGLKPVTEDPGGDLRAVEGTVAEVTIQTDRPLSQGIVALEGDKRIGLSGDQTTYKVEVPIQKDGMYHFAVMDHGQEVRLSDDYFIEARKDNPPTLKVVKPGRDAKVSPIEEVAITVEAQDDFGLHEVQLHYSVNGGEEKTVNLMKGAGQKEVRGATTLFLEDQKLVPGDVIALYATARDARQPAKSDIYFIEAQPFERNYSQSQQMGGGGGGGDQDDEGRDISRRQKEIIAATWNETRGNAQRNSAESAENARFLAEVQNKLREQANSLSERSKSRQIAGTNAEFQSFIKSMDEAVKEMGAAADKLKGQNWKDALPAEQRALQNLLRAEATFRDIQVAFNNRGQQGGGKSGAARDLDNLFDLELDTEKNQYETGQQSASSDQRQKEIDEALQRLEQLARRQQELAQQQQQQKQNFDQRWQQEQLRREAEQLRQKMEQLTRGQQSSQSGSSSQQSSSGQQQSSSGSQGSQSSQSAQQRNQQQQSRLQRGGQEAANEQRLREAFDRLQQATEDMRRAASSPDQRDAGARRAADRLNEAKDLMRGIRQQQTQGQLAGLGERADKLAAEQQEFYNRMRRQFGNGQQQQSGGQNSGEAEQMAKDKERMAKDLESLERDAQRAARDLAGSQPKASSKLRDAVSAVQQDEVPLRMKYSANYIRQGKGQYMVTSEAVSAMALGKMRDQIKEAQAEAEKGGGAQQDGKPSETGKALAQVERLREQLERASRGQQQGGQQQGGQQQGGQQQGGQQQGGQQQGGEQSGQQSGRGQQQQSGNTQNGGSRQGGDATDARGGLNRGNLPDRPAGDGGGIERAFRETVRDLSQLRQQVGGNSELGREISDFIRDLQRIDPSAYALAGPALGDRLQKEVLPAMEQLEIQLRRKLDQENGGQVRNPAAERVPPGYSDKVADYFRRLSGAKK